MAINIKRPNGTEDVLPKDIHKWYTIEKIAREILPTLQAHIEIVNKEDVWTKILIDGAKICH